MKKREISFASVLHNPIYKDRDVLFAQIPPTGFVHRENQRAELIMELAPILMKSPVNCVFVYGNPGTGKTALIKELITELKEEAKKEKIGIETAYVNCSENRTETSIILSILPQIDSTRKYPAMGWNRNKTLGAFKKVLKKGKNVLAVLDEIDYALKESGDDIIYRLSRINSSATSVKTALSTIIISNDVKVYDYIKPKTQSAIGRIKIIFAPYNSEELADIMRERAAFAFKEKIVSDAVLQKIAEIESNRGGDARKALELLDACAKVAIAKGRDKITLDLVDEADKSQEENTTLHIITSLPKHQKIVYLAILKIRKKEIDGVGVYKKYLELCEKSNVEPLSERRVRTFLINLDEAGLISAEVGWLKSQKKKTRKIKLIIDKALKVKAMKLLKRSI